MAPCRKKLAHVLPLQEQVWEEDFSSLGHYLQETIGNDPEQMSVYVAYVNQQSRE
jgi:hypothetical protein